MRLFGPIIAVTLVLLPAAQLIAELFKSELVFLVTGCALVSFWILAEAIWLPRSLSVLNEMELGPDEIRHAHFVRMVVVLLSVGVMVLSQLYLGAGFMQMIGVGEIVLTASAVVLVILGDRFSEKREMMIPK